MIAPYHRELVRRLRSILDRDLVGVYAGGSWALGDYEPGRSDLDVATVTRGALAPPAKKAIVAAVRHEALPCPARGLELVVYAEPVVRASDVEAAFELNLNTGARMAFRAELEPGGETHWFAIDRAILRAHGISLFGPSPADVFAPLPRRPLVGVLAEGIRWWRAEEPASPDAVLNACRSLSFAAGGAWVSKRAAGEWAAENGPDPALARDALAAWRTAAPLDAARVRRFLDAVETRLGEEIAQDEADHGR